MKSIKTLLINAALLFVFCAPAFSWAQSFSFGSMFESDNRQADTYRRNDAMAEGNAETCKVVRVRNVRLEAGNTAKVVASGAGAILGGAIGANQAGGSGYSAQAALGGILGAVVGNTVAQKVMSNEGQEYILNCNGRIKTIVQESDDTPPAPKGSEVYLMQGQGRTRVVS